MMYIPISKSSILFLTAPLYLPFLAHYILGESVTRIDIIAILLGFCGVVLINKPSFDADNNMFSNELKGACLGLLSGLCNGISQICMRKVRKKCHFSIGPFYNSLGCTILGILLYLYEHSHHTYNSKYDMTTIFLLLIISTWAFLSQILLVLSYQYEKVARVAIFSYLQTMLVMVYDIVFFGHIFKIIEFLGALVIMASSFTVALLRFRRHIH